MISAQVEPLTRQSIAEMEAIFPIHYEELSQHKARGFALDPDYDIYLRKAAAGEVLYVALREEGRIIGYFVGFVGRSLHYRDCLQLMPDIFYVVPDSRGARGGAMLFTAVRAEAKRRGVSLIVVGAKEEHREYVEPLLSGMGFMPFERYHSLWL